MRKNAAGDALDPICGMNLQPHQVAADYTYLGVVYAFCSTECRDMFARTPEIFVVVLAHEPNMYYGHRCPHQRI